eukprot:6577147-Pyramimonas_sp.AAC.1
MGPHRRHTASGARRTRNPWSSRPCGWPTKTAAGASHQGSRACQEIKQKRTTAARSQAALRRVH